MVALTIPYPEMVATTLQDLLGEALDWQAPVCVQQVVNKHQYYINKDTLAELALRDTAAATAWVSCLPEDIREQKETP